MRRELKSTDARPGDEKRGIQKVEKNAGSDPISLLRSATDTSINSVTVKVDKCCQPLFTQIGYPFYEPRETAKMRSLSRATNNQRLDGNSQDRNATNATLPDGWFEVTKITNRKTINDKIHFLVHWSDRSKSYEPEDNITDAAEAAYYASCRTKRKPRDRQ